jgi:chemotaxis signal transduction protein
MTPVSVSNLTANVFEGITANGSITGTPVTGTDLLALVNAVWRVGRTSGSGDLGVNFKWDQSLEGSLFSTQANARIGVIQNSGTAWGMPFGTGDNVINSADATVTSVGYFGIGSQPLMTPFVFNAIAPKTYGDADFNTGVTSLNTTQPVLYTSSNPAVATISSTGFIHIVGVGTTDINASQATDGNYLAANETQQLIVNKASLTITADDKTKFEGAANPILTATFTGFVNGETESILQTPVSLSTTATIASVTGTYPITPSSATAENYNINFVDGVLNVVGRIIPVITFNSIPAVTYGDADFNANASSDNPTVPVVLTSSNNNVATVSNGIIHITGAGTTTITASQAGDGGYFPAADVTVTIIVNKAPLSITVVDTVKLQGNPNPQFRFIYTGFVYNETEAVLNTPVSVNTNATINAAPGIYTVSPTGAASNNYSFTYVDGKLTVYPQDSSLQTINAYHNGSGQLMIKIFSPNPDLGAVMLYDQQGRYLGKKDIFVVQGFTATQIDISKLASAYYIVAFRGKKGTVSQLISVIK